jgi:hypothetical protein
MKNVVLKFGLISGALSAAFMLATIPFIDKIGFDNGMYVGFSSMLVAFLLVFFGVRSYRENVSHGHIGFFKALGVGTLIMVISVACYVVTWEIVYAKFLPDFSEKYTTYAIDKAKKSGTPPEQIAKTIEEMNQFKSMYDHRLYRIFFTFLEPLPIGLPVTLLSALILRRRAPVTHPDQTPIAVGS